MKLLLQKTSSSVSNPRDDFPMQPTYPSETPPVRGQLPTRALVELALGFISVVLLALALLWPHWIESLFGSSPDAGDGSAEYGVALFWAAVSIVMFAMAGHTWRKQIRTSSILHAMER